MKKRLLLIAVAGAIVVGCADEMLDTSYESVLKEAQLKGEHPMIFNAYVGNGMAVTRNLVSSGDFLTKASHMTGDYYGGSYAYAIDKSAGVFAYYTGKKGIASNPMPGVGSMYDTSPSGYTLESGNFFTGTSYVDRFNTFLDNTRLMYSSSNWKTYFISGSGASYNQERTVYWPAKQYGSSTPEYMSFYAYYPHANVGYSSYDDALKNGSINLRLVRDGYTIPALDYTVATPEDNFSSLDLMAAAVQNVAISSSPSAVNLSFKHLLAAVSVKINYSDNDNNTTVQSPDIYFTNAELRGADSNGDVKSNTQFRKRGIFSLYDGTWQLSDSFEPLNLLGYSWLTRDRNFYNLSESKYYSFLDNLKTSTSTNWYVGTANDLTDGTKVSNDKYMLIIPNSKQEKLALDLSYLIKNGSYTENIDIQKTLDLKIEPGKVYQILLTISKNKLAFNVTINNWTINSPGTNPGI